MDFDSDQDWGPFNTLFHTFAECRLRVKIIGRFPRDCVVLAVEPDGVRLHWFRSDDEDDPTGTEEYVEFEKIDELLVY